MKNFRWQHFTYRNPYLFALGLLIVAVVVNFILQPDLFDPKTLNNNMRVFLPLILLSAGQAVVILAGGIDISVGAIVSVVNALLATQIGLKGDPNQAVLWMIVALFVGMMAGAINGFFVAYLRLQPIITTYATSFLFAGLALFILPNPGGGMPVVVHRVLSRGHALGSAAGVLPHLPFIKMAQRLDKLDEGKG